VRRIFAVSISRTTPGHVVKAVLIGLAFASVVTWTVWFAKSVEIAFAQRRVRLALNVLTSAGSLPESIERSASPKGEVTKLLDAVRVEFRLSPDSVEPNSIKERIASRVERIQARYGRQILRGTGVVTIGATAPFVGLFGTVWGIMNSLIGISKSRTTTLRWWRRALPRHYWPPHSGLPPPFRPWSFTTSLRGPSRVIARCSAMRRPRCSG
jgi:biopolymer transport protein ExbB/TolQ